VKKAKVTLATRLTCLPDQTGDHPVILVYTDLPAGGNNAFYIDTKDLKGQVIHLSWDHPPGDTPDPTELNSGDTIEFDCQDGIFHKAVLWNKRKIRQIGYSFDDYASTK
jgi:hypothetical protein